MKFKRVGDLSMKVLHSGSLAAAAAALALLAPIAHSAQPVLQRGYDAGVTGATLTETTLNASNVSPAAFGLVFKLPVDDSVFAQPLYVPNVAVPNNGVHNVVYVATMSDSVYAFDADAGGAPLWSINLATLVNATPVPIANFVFMGNQNIVGNLGVLSTPVIDATTNLMYVIACTLENNSMTYRLHALDITTGAEPNGPGVLISGGFRGSTFDARYQLQRMSLALSGNQVVFGFSALELEFAGGYVGWVMAYDKSTLQQSGVFATVTTGNRGGGVWQSGRPPVVDSSGYVYVFVGNAFGGGYDGVNDFSESALKLDPAHGLKLLDWFTPSAWSYMDTNDRDLSSSGPLLIPGTTFIAGGGKTGDLYVLNTSNLGKFNANDSQIVQKETITAKEFRGGPVYWQRSAANGGSLLYNWGVLDWIKAYPFTGTQFAASPSAQGSAVQLTPGGILTLSANGELSGSGVLWATVATSGDAVDNPPVPGELVALNAENVSQELWNSEMNPSRDEFGNFAKFVPPLVANGKVYVATWSNQVVVYGLLATYTVAPTSLAFGSETANVASPPMSVTVTNTGTANLPITNITLSGTDSSQFSQTNTCGNSVTLGSQCTISVVFNPGSAAAKSAMLSVNGGGAGTQTVALTGIGVVTSYAVSPTSLGFGSETANVASPAMSVAVTNTGSATLPITNITLSGIDYSQFSQTNTCGNSVTLGSQCVINVVFKPTTAGSKSATLNVNAGSGPIVIPLSGVAPLSVSVKANAATVTVGKPAILTWLATSGATCSAAGGSATDGWPDSIPVSGSKTVTESTAGTYIYRLSCTAGSQAEQVQTSVVFTWPTVTAVLTASPTTVSAGQATTLTWSSANASGCSATGGDASDGWLGTKPTSGSASVTETSAPTAPLTLNFVLTCTSTASDQSAQAFAKVVENPPPSAAKSGGGGSFDGLSLIVLLTFNTVFWFQHRSPTRKMRYSH
jgi:hypothetical protein